MDVVWALALAVCSLWALYALLSVAFSLGFRVGGFFDLSVGASFLVGAYASCVCARVMPVPAAVAIGVCLSGFAAMVIGRWLVAPLAVRHPPLALFIATLAVLYLAQSLAAVAFGNAAMLLRTGGGRVLVFGGMRVTELQAWFGAAAAAALLALGVWLRLTSWGRFARAVSDDRVLAGLFGIPVQATVFRCYTAAGAMAGLAGAYFAADRSIDPSQGLVVLLSAMVAGIVGGESLRGVVAGALMLAVIETGLGFALPGNWQATVAFGTLLVVMVARGGALAPVVRRRT